MTHDSILFMALKQLYMHLIAICQAIDMLLHLIWLRKRENKQKLQNKEENPKRQILGGLLTNDW